MYFDDMHSYIVHVQENPERMTPTSYRRKIEYVYGESDGETIWISRTTPMSFEELLNTLIHEVCH